MDQRLSVSEPLHQHNSRTNMDEEQKDFEAALLRSVEDMKAGRLARKTVFEVDGDEVRRVQQELPSQKNETPHKAGSVGSSEA